VAIIKAESINEITLLSYQVFSIYAQYKILSQKEGGIRWKKRAIFVQGLTPFTRTSGCGSLMLRVGIAIYEKRRG